MPRGRRKAAGPTNHDILNAALAGLELQKAKIDAQIQHVRGLLGKRGPGRPRTTGATVAPGAPAAAGKKKRRTLSAAARKRIAAAQKKRWAEFRKKMGGKEGA